LKTTCKWRMKTLCEYVGCSDCGGDGYTSKYICSMWKMSKKKGSGYIRVEESIEHDKPNGGLLATPSQLKTAGCLVGDDDGNAHGVHLTSPWAAASILENGFKVNGKDRRGRHGAGGYFAQTNQLAINKLPRHVSANLLVEMRYRLHVGRQMPVNSYGQWTEHLGNQYDSVLVVGPNYHTNRVVVLPQDCLNQSILLSTKPYFRARKTVEDISSKRRKVIDEAMNSLSLLDQGNDYYEVYRGNKKVKEPNWPDRAILSLAHSHIDCPSVTKILDSNDSSIVIKDKNPAVETIEGCSFHWLVLPTHNYLLFQNVSQLNHVDLPMINAMITQARALVEKLHPGVDSSSVHMGFHTPPSVSYLHMHVISSIEDVSSDRRAEFESGPKFVQARDVVQHLTPDHVYYDAPSLQNNSSADASS